MNVISITEFHPWIFWSLNYSFLLLKRTKTSDTLRFLSSKAEECPFKEKTKLFYGAECPRKEKGPFWAAEVTQAITVKENSPAIAVLTKLFDNGPLSTLKIRVSKGRVPQKIWVPRPVPSLGFCVPRICVPGRIFNFASLEICVPRVSVPPVPRDASLDTENFLPIFSTSSISFYFFTNFKALRIFL